MQHDGMTCLRQGPEDFDVGLQEALVQQNQLAVRRVSKKHRQRPANWKCRRLQRVPVSQLHDCSEVAQHEAALSVSCLRPICHTTCKIGPPSS